LTRSYTWNNIKVTLSKEDKKMAKVVIQVNYLVKEGKLDEFVEHLLTNSKNSLNEPGCLNYEAAVDGNHVFLYEKYVDMDAFEFHKTTPHFANYGAAVKDLLLERDVKVFTAL